MKPVRHFHFLFSGFRQRWSDHGNGFSHCYRKLRADYPQAEVIWLPWYVDPGDLAAMVVNHTVMLPNGESAGVTVAGYSFGGTTAVELCRQLYLRNDLPVEALCLVDGVKRHSRHPWGWISAFNRLAKFRLPPNVRACEAFYQRENWPRGHAVLAAPGTQQRVHWIRLDDPHAVVDNHPLVRAAVVEHARRVH